MKDKTKQKIVAKTDGYSISYSEEQNSPLASYDPSVNEWLPGIHDAQTLMITLQCLIRLMHGMDMDEDYYYDRIFYQPGCSPKETFNFN